MFGLIFTALLFVVVARPQSQTSNYMSSIQSGAFDYYDYTFTITGQGYASRSNILDIESRRSGWRDALLNMKNSLALLPFDDDFLQYHQAYAPVLNTLTESYGILGRSGAANSATVTLSHTLSSMDFFELYSGDTEEWDVVFDPAFLASRKRADSELRRKVRDKHNFEYRTKDDYKRITRIVFLLPRGTGMPLLDFGIYLSGSRVFSYRNIQQSYRGKPLFRFKSGFNYSLIKKTYPQPVYYVEAEVLGGVTWNNEKPYFQSQILYGISIDPESLYLLHSIPELRTLMVRGEYEFVFSEGR